MDDLAMWSLIVGFFLPKLLATVIQTKWSEKEKAIVAFVGCLVAAVGTTYFTDGFGGGNYVSSALAIFVAAQVSYKALWKPTGVAPAIETKTNVN